MLRVDCQLSQMGTDEDKAFMLQLRQWFWSSEQLSSSVLEFRSGRGLGLYLLAVSLGREL